MGFPLQHMQKSKRILISQTTMETLLTNEEWLGQFWIHWLIHLPLVRQVINNIFCFSLDDFYILLFSLFLSLAILRISMYRTAGNATVNETTSLLNGTRTENEYPSDEQISRTLGQFWREEISIFAYNIFNHVAGAAIAVALDKYVLS